jgi:hypothetical protein
MRRTWTAQLTLAFATSWHESPHTMPTPVPEARLDRGRGLLVLHCRQQVRVDVHREATEEVVAAAAGLISRVCGLFARSPKADGPNLVARVLREPQGSAWPGGDAIRLAAGRGDVELGDDDPVRGDPPDVVPRFLGEP